MKIEVVMLITKNYPLGRGEKSISSVVKYIRMHSRTLSKPLGDVWHKRMRMDISFFFSLIPMLLNYTTQHIS